MLKKIQTSQLNPVGRGAWVLRKLIRRHVRDSGVDISQQKTQRCRE